MKPIKLYGHVQGPNPWKVAILLEELKVPYENEFLEMAQFKQEPFESVNPNGRVPAIEDPNTGVTLWESGAIIEYLIDQYDKSHELSYDSFAEKYVTKSWLFFQVSGQGPYFGQYIWFSKYHPEKNLTSAIDRYANEIKRVHSVIDRHLKKQGTQYLVGDKCTYADLAFLNWDEVTQMMEGYDPKTEVPNWYAWNQRMMQRPAVKKAYEEKAKLSKN